MSGSGALSLELLGSDSARPGSLPCVPFPGERVVELPGWGVILETVLSGRVTTRPRPCQTKTRPIRGASFILKAHHRLPCREAIFEGSGTDSTEQKCEDSALSLSSRSLRTAQHRCWAFLSATSSTILSERRRAGWQSPRLR